AEFSDIGAGDADDHGKCGIAGFDSDTGGG
ncbi:MAG: hypothetical protein RLZ97_433, partial [Verrucomicrobiota bacterium]